MLKKLRTLASIRAGVITARVIGLLKQSGGSALPGLVSLKIDPYVLSYLARNLKIQILVTGTNGKTTTSRLIAAYFMAQKIPFVHNRIGSNLKRGLVSSLIEPFFDKRLTPQTWGLFEVDEADMINVVSDVWPDFIIITNLFRDQLDRYGEVDTILTKWEKALNLARDAVVLLNGNDPYLVYLSTRIKNPVYFFGIHDHKVGQPALTHTADTVFCYRCQNRIKYTTCYLSHEGLFSCPKCGLNTPAIHFSADRIALCSNRSEFQLSNRAEQLIIHHFLPGLYHVLNLTAVYGLINLLNLPLAPISVIAQNFQPAFGRGERLTIGDKQIQILLIKNPTGLNEVIQRLRHEPDKLNLLIIINDKIADGRDVSWLWDADFERLLAHTKSLIISGRRCLDMGLRAKVAHYQRAHVMSDLNKAWHKFINIKERKLFILPTYTALWAIRSILNQHKLVNKTWQD